MNQLAARNYLHCPCLSQFLHSPAITFFFRSDTEKHLKVGSRPGDPGEESSLTRSLDSCCDDPSDDDDEVVSSLASLRLGM